MLSSAATLGATQVARAATPRTAENESLAKRSFLEGFRRRNAALDAIFYDVGRISGAEAIKISPWLAKEGALLLVPPSDAGELILCEDVADLASRSKAEEIVALAVAGVGSSALGSAAFARNVADAVGGPVVAVVSGYGLADLLTEAMGGFFWFGALNGLRHDFEALDTLALDTPDPASPTGDTLLVRMSYDTATVIALLRDPRFTFRLLVGHSKGNLVLSEALYALKRQIARRAAAIADKAKIVTVGARIAMPPLFRDVVDVMGALDWFGGFNSRQSIPADHLVPGAWHHTNTELPMHLPVTAALREILPASSPA